MAEEYDLTPRRYSRQLVAQLRDYRWQGNVRELKNMVESVLLMGDENTVRLAELPLEIAEQIRYEDPDATANLKGLEITERHTIELAVRDCQGNLTQEAKQLGISRSTLYRKLEHYSLTY